MTRVLLISALIAALVPVAAAEADTSALPTPGTTTECSFSPKPAPARTTCRILTITVTGPTCFEHDGQSFLLYDISYFARAIEYAGNVVTGEPVDGYYRAVRPNAKVIYDSGVHAFGTGATVPVDSC